MNFATGASSNLTSLHPAENYLTPLVYEGNLNIQYEFLPTWVLELGYVGSHGIHQSVSNTQQINEAQLVGSPLGTNTFVAPAIAAGLVTTNTSSNASLRVPYLGFAPGGLTRQHDRWRRQVQQPPGDRTEATLPWVAVSGSLHVGQVPHHGQPNSNDPNNFQAAVRFESLLSPTAPGREL